MSFFIVPSAGRVNLKYDFIILIFRSGEHS
jgi:hypothetical protein